MYSQEIGHGGNCYILILILYMHILSKLDIRSTYVYARG